MSKHGCIFAKFKAKKKMIELDKIRKRRG